MTSAATSASAPPLVVVSSVPRRVPRRAIDERDTQREALSERHTQRGDKEIEERRIRGEGGDRDMGKEGEREAREVGKEGEMK